MSASREDSIRAKTTRRCLGFNRDQLPVLGAIRGKLRCRIEALINRVMRTSEEVVVYLVDADFRALNNNEDNRERIEQIVAEKRVIGFYKRMSGHAAADIAEMIVDDLTAEGCLWVPPDSGT